MRETRVELMEIAKLTADAGFKERQTAVLAGEELHLWFPVPLVRNGHILLGESTVARAIKHNRTHMYCRLVECAEESALAARALDVALGSFDETVAFVFAVSHEIEFNEVLPKRKGPGRPLTPRGEARRRVARWLDTSEEQLRFMEGEHGRRQGAPAKAQSREEWKLECYGFKPADGVAESAARVRKQLHNIDFSVRRMLGSFTALEDEPIGDLMEAKSLSRRLGPMVRGCLPHALCPWCKSMDGIRVSCLACSGTGWVPKYKYEAAPKELLVQAVIVRHGQVLDMRTMLPLGKDTSPREAYFGNSDSYEEEEEPPL